MTAPFGKAGAWAKALVGRVAATTAAAATNCKALRRFNVSMSAPVFFVIAPF
jgi:hypothetical protein